MPRRNLSGEPPPPQESKIARCQSCGVGLTGPARRQYICSWCKGDPAHGSDNYFNDMIDAALLGEHKGLPREIVRDILNGDKR